MNFERSRKLKIFIIRFIIYRVLWSPESLSDSSLFSKRIHTFFQNSILQKIKPDREILFSAKVRQENSRKKKIRMNLKLQKRHPPLGREMLKGMRKMQIINLEDYSGRVSNMINLLVHYFWSQSTKKVLEIYLRLLPN